MFKILLAITQAATEFLPISSSGHLAILSKLVSEPDIFLFTTLHLASLLAVVIFVRKELIELLKFDLASRKLLVYLLVATIPAALVGLFFKSAIEKAFHSYLLVGIAFIFTSIVIFLTKFRHATGGMNMKKALLIGLAQILALLPGVSRSGITISSAVFLGVDKEKAMKFSFLLFIPLSLGAFILEAGDSFYINPGLIISFFVCLGASLLFLKILLLVIKKDKFWVFSIYCFAIGLVTAGMHFIKG